jgi:hypothetical protein
MISVEVSQSHRQGSVSDNPRKYAIEQDAQGTGKETLVWNGAMREWAIRNIRQFPSGHVPDNCRTRSRGLMAGKLNRRNVTSSDEVQVILDWRGGEPQMLARESWTREEFTNEVKGQLGLLGSIEVNMLGALDWAVKAGHTYEVKETKKMNIKIRDNDGRNHPMAMKGNTTAQEICEQFRQSWKLEPCIAVAIKRKDGGPFFLGDKGEYNLITQYDPHLDPSRL